MEGYLNTMEGYFNDLGCSAGGTGTEQSYVTSEFSIHVMMSYDEKCAAELKWLVGSMLLLLTRAVSPLLAH